MSQALSHRRAPTPSRIVEPVVELKEVSKQFTDSSLTFFFLSFFFHRVLFYLYLNPIFSQASLLLFGEGVLSVSDGGKDILVTVSGEGLPINRPAYVGLPQLSRSQALVLGEWKRAS